MFVCITIISDRETIKQLIIRISRTDSFRALEFTIQVQTTTVVNDYFLVFGYLYDESNVPKRVF